MNSTSSKSYDIPKLMSLICTPLLVVAGVILNFLTIMVFCRRKMRKYTLSTSMISLAITDIAVLTIPVFLTWVDELFFEFYYLSNTIWCNLHSYLDLVFCGSSAWIIILVSIERWFAVCKPWHKSKYFTNNRVLFAIIFIYILAITCFIYFPFVIDRDRKKQICVLRSNKVYSILGTISIILVYVIPFLALAVLNSMIILRLRMRPFANTHVISSINSTSTYSNNNNNSNNSNNNSSFKVNYTNNATNNNNSNNSNNNSITNNTLVTLLQTNMSNNDRNLSITLVTVAATYMILTFPFQVFWLYSYFVEYFFNNNNDEQFNYSNSTNLFLNNTNSKIETDYTTDSHSMSFNWSSTRFYLIDITFTIRNTNYMINFFLYSAVSKLFRQEFLALITEKENIFIRILCFLCFRKSSNKQDKSRKLSSIRLKSYYDTNNYTTKRTSFTYKTDNTPCTNTTNNELSKANPSRQGSARQKLIKKNSCEEFQIQDLQQSEQIVTLIDNDNSLINAKSTKTSATQTKYSSITIARKLNQINKNKNIVKT